MTCKCGEGKFRLLGWNGPDLVMECKTCGREYTAKNCNLESAYSDLEGTMNEDGTVTMVIDYEESQDGVRPEAR